MLDSFIAHGVNDELYFCIEVYYLPLIIGICVLSGYAISKYLKTEED